MFQHEIFQSKKKLYTTEHLTLLNRKDFKKIIPKNVCVFKLRLTCQEKVF